MSWYDIFNRHQFFINHCAFHISESFFSVKHQPLSISPVVLLCLLSELYPPGVWDHTFLKSLLSLQEIHFFILQTVMSFPIHVKEVGWSTPQLNATMKKLKIRKRIKIIFMYLFTVVLICAFSNTYLNYGSL